MVVAIASSGDAIWKQPPAGPAAPPDADGEAQVAGSNVAAQLLLHPEDAETPERPELLEVDRILLGAHPSAAQSVLGALRAQVPEEPRVMRRAAVASFLAGDYAEAASQFEAWRRRRPDSPEASAGLCAALLHEGRLGDAAATIRPVIARWPDHLLVQYQATLLRVAGFLESPGEGWRPDRFSLPEAVIVASLLESDRPDLEGVLSPETFAKACSILLGEGTDLALSQIAGSLAEGATALQQGRWLQARKALGRAVTAGASARGVRLEFARSLFEAGETDLSSAELSWLLRDFPDDGQVLYNYGYVLLKAGDYAGAAGNFRKALQAMPGNSQARFALACALAGAGHRDEAWAVFEPLASAPPAELAQWLAGDQAYLKALRADPRVDGVAAGMR